MGGLKFWPNRVGFKISTWPSLAPRHRRRRFLVDVSARPERLEPRKDFGGEVEDEVAGLEKEDPTEDGEMLKKNHRDHFFNLSFLSLF